MRNKGRILAFLVATALAAISLSACGSMGKDALPSSAGTGDSAEASASGVREISVGEAPTEETSPEETSPEETDPPEETDDGWTLSLSTASEEWTEAMESYKKFLSGETIRWVDGDPLVSAGMQFMTEDINGDGIPELIVHNREYPEFGTIGVYTYHGFTDELCGGDELGSYYPGTGVFTSVHLVTKSDGNLSKTEEVYWYLKDTSELSTAARMVNWQLQIGLHETMNDGADDYYWLGVYHDDESEAWANGSHDPISQEEFETSLQSLTGGAEKVQIQPNWVDNNEENREAYLN